MKCSILGCGRESEVDLNYTQGRNHGRRYLCAVCYKAYDMGKDEIRTKLYHREHAFQKRIEELNKKLNN